VGIVCTLLLAYFLVVLGRIILSWFPLDPDGIAAQLYGLLITLTEPVLGPLRRAIPPVRMGAMALDLSPLILIIGIQVLQGIICS
jgi:YggT family protein